MESSSQLANRFREVILNGKWIADTNYKEQLSDLPWEVATTKFESLNTIALLAQHIHYYINGIKHALEGGGLSIRDKYSFDFQPLASQEEWDNFLATFWSDAEAFSLLVEHMPEEKLKALFFDKKYGTSQRNIEAMIEHGYYHLGQIVLIKKMLVKKRDGK
jgi:hypothetical protein